MAFDVLGFVDGALGTAESVRRLTWLATRGASGLATADSLKVTATSPPTSSVVIATGAAVAVNTYAGAAPAQSYVISATSPTTVTVPANTSGSQVVRSLWAVAHDPQYGDNTFPDTHLSTVWTLATDPPPAGTALLLATVTLPANTATVTQAMIAGAQPLVNPRTQRVQLMGYPTTNEAVNGSPSYSSFTWVQTYAPTVQVPDWASTAFVRCNITNAVYNGVGSPLKTQYPPPDNTTSNIARVRIQFGGALRPPEALNPPPQTGLVGPLTEFQASGPNILPLSIFTAAQFDVVQYRGQSKLLSLDGMVVRVSGTGAFKFWADTGTQIVYDINFTEQ